MLRAADAESGLSSVSSSLRKQRPEHTPSRRAEEALTGCVRKSSKVAAQAEEPAETEHVARVVGKIGRAHV